MAKHVLVDTGFWYALYDSSDAFHKKAQDISTLIENHQVLVPFPTLYETINTKFSKQKIGMASLNSFLKKANVHLLDDTKYKDDALRVVFESALIGKRTFSLVDVLLREIILDTKFKIDYLITFNIGDFSDVCAKRNIEIYT